MLLIEKKHKNGGEEGIGKWIKFNSIIMYPILELSKTLTKVFISGQRSI